MDDSLADVVRLLRLAQTGHREQALALANERLGAAVAPGMLYARAVALHCTGDHEGAARTADDIISLTTTGDLGQATAAENNGWHSIALSYRALERMRLCEMNKQAFDVDSILSDLTRAEALLSDGVSDGFVLATAHGSLGNVYNELRLFELISPHYEAAFAAAIAGSDVLVERAVATQVNLAAVHLNWAMELLRIGDDAGAGEKCVIAARHAAIAMEYAASDEAQPYAAHAGLLYACAASNRGDAHAAVAGIREGLSALEGVGGARESRAFALPFLARALDRAGEHSAAVQVATQAISALPHDATWVTAAPAYHTHATLLAQSGSAAALSALTYGDRLAETMWRQRLRTLHNARSMQVLERITLERDLVQILAHTDALTGVGNRRAFDVRMAEHNTSPADSTEVALIVVDVDGLKAVNDTGGHEAGDRTLEAVARAMTGQVRARDLVARLGGDEFVAVLEGLDRVAAEEAAQRMVEAVSVALGSTVTVSVGVATGPAAEAGSSLLRAADRAMYAAKRNRRVVGTGSQPAVADSTPAG